MVAQVAVKTHHHRNHPLSMQGRCVPQEALDVAVLVLPLRAVVRAPERCRRMHRSHPEILRVSSE